EGSAWAVSQTAECLNLWAALSSGSQLWGPYSIRPQSGIAAAIARLFGGYDEQFEAGDWLPAESDSLLAEPGAFPPAGGDATLGGQAIDRLFGGDRAALSDRAIDHVFSAEDGALSSEEAGVGAGVGAAVALLGTGFFMGDRLQDREGKLRLPRRRIWPREGHAQPA